MTTPILRAHNAHLRTLQTYKAHIELLKCDAKTIDEKVPNVEQKYKDLLALVDMYCSNASYDASNSIKNTEWMIDDLNNKMNTEDKKTDSVKDKGGEEERLNRDTKQSVERANDYACSAKTVEECTCSKEDEKGFMVAKLVARYECGTTVEIPFKFDSYGSLDSIELIYHLDSVDTYLPVVKNRNGGVTIKSSDYIYCEALDSIESFRWAKANGDKNYEGIPMCTELFDNWDQEEEEEDSESKPLTALTLEHRAEYFVPSDEPNKEDFCDE